MSDIMTCMSFRAADGMGPSGKKTGKIQYLGYIAHIQ